MTYNPISSVRARQIIVTPCLFSEEAKFLKKSFRAFDGDHDGGLLASFWKHIASISTFVTFVAYNLVATERQDWTSNRLKVATLCCSYLENCSNTYFKPLFTLKIALFFGAGATPIVVIFCCSWDLQNHKVAISCCSSKLDPPLGWRSKFENINQTTKVECF